MLAMGTVTSERGVVNRKETLLGPAPKSIVARMAFSVACSGVAEDASGSGYGVAVSASALGVVVPAPPQASVIAITSRANDRAHHLAHFVKLIANIPISLNRLSHCQALLRYLVCISQR